MKREREKERGREKGRGEERKGGLVGVGGHQLSRRKDKNRTKQDIHEKGVKTRQKRDKKELEEREEREGERDKERETGSAREGKL